MKNITFIIGMLSGGGAERVVASLANNLANFEIEINVILLYSNKNDYLENERVNIIPIVSNRKNKPLKVMERLFLLRKKIKEIQPDIIISFDSVVNIYTILAKSFLNIPLIISERNDPNQYPKSNVLRQLRDKLYHIPEKIVFQTKDAKDYFPTNIQQTSTIISNPIKNDLPFWDSQNHKKRIITASRLTSQKNLEMLIIAFSEISQEYPDYELVIFGEGELRKKLESLISKLNLENKAFLPGFSKEIHEEMTNSALFVLSSNHEGMSNSMLEALAVGIPVISTDAPIGAAKMFIKNYHNGILIEVGNTHELVEAMRNIISNSELANKFSNNSIIIREELNEDKITNEWIQVISEIIN